MCHMLVDAAVCVSSEIILCEEQVCRRFPPPRVSIQHSSVACCSTPKQKKNAPGQLCTYIHTYLRTYVLLSAIASRLIPCCQQSLLSLRNQLQQPIVELLDNSNFSFLSTISHLSPYVCTYVCIQTKNTIAYSLPPQLALPPGPKGVYLRKGAATGADYPARRRCRGRRNQATAGRQALPPPSFLGQQQASWAGGAARAAAAAAELEPCCPPGGPRSCRSKRRRNCIVRR